MRDINGIIRRSLRAIFIVAVVIGIGTIGFHYISGYGYVYAFFFSVMIATGEGPPTTPSTALGQIFAAVMSIIGIGTVVVSLLYLFGPAFMKLFRLGEYELRKEEKRLGRRYRRAGA